MLSGNTLYLYDPCGDFLFTGEEQPSLERDDHRKSPTAPAHHQQGQRGAASTMHPHSSRRSPSSSSRTPSPSSSSGTVRPRSAFSSACLSSSARGGEGGSRTVTGLGGANRSPRGSGYGEWFEAGTSRREPLGRRYSVRREDVFNQFPDQVNVVGARPCVVLLYFFLAFCFGILDCPSMSQIFVPSRLPLGLFVLSCVGFSALVQIVEFVA